MEKKISFLIVWILVLSGIGAVATQNENNNFEQITISFSQPVIKNEEQYISLTINEANSFLMKQGKPMLPSYEKSFYYPFKTKIKSVIITPKNIEELTLINKISPTPKMVQVGQKVEKNSNEVDYGNEPYPEKWFDYKIFSGIIGDKRKTIVKTEVFPIKYYPNENKIQLARAFDIKIIFETPIVQFNYNADYSFVILTPSEFSSQLTSLVNHKISNEITTKLVTLTEINSGTYFPATGRDDQEKIKYFIKNAIENWATSNVLLVGSATKFPIRLTHVFIEDDPQYGDEIFVSDLYYADIYDGDGEFCSWDSNGNNVFGEYNWGTSHNYDEVDLHPDVNLGRWACRSTSDVTACVNKDIAYETSQAYQQDWFLNLVVVGGDSFPGDTNAIDEGEYVNQKVIDLMTSFIPNKLWASNGKLSGWSPTGVANIINTISAGCGFVDFSGHGNTNIWATHPHENPNVWLPTPTGYLFSANVQTLSNGAKLPIVTVEACSTSKFNVDDNCLNWAFMYNSGGGAIGTFGATGIGYGYVGTGVTQGLIGKIGLDTFRAYKLNGAKTYGEMWSYCLNRYIKTSMSDSDYKTVEEWQPFGDPTIAIAEESNPPSKPSTPNGPIEGSVGVSYTYSTVATDPDGDKIYYMFDWGDGTTSGWIGPVNSGSSGSASKTFNKEGTYSIKAIAKDTHGKIGQWSDPLSVKMPRTRAIIKDIQGTFYAEIGVTGNTQPQVFLNGKYLIRTRFTIFGGIATYENHQARFKGLFFNNYFAIRAPIGQKTITIFGRCSFDENHETFTGRWRTRLNILNGWINGEINPN